MDMFLWCLASPELVCSANTLGLVLESAIAVEIRVLCLTPGPGSPLPQNFESSPMEWAARNEPTAADVAASQAESGGGVNESNERKLADKKG